MIPVPMKELEDLYQQIKHINENSCGSTASRQIQSALKELLAHRHEERRKSEQRG